MIWQALGESSIQALEACSKLYIGYSGGLDSSVLLSVLAQQARLRPKLTAIHINHGLNKKASDWQHFCRAQADALGVAFKTFDVNLTCTTNIEERARKARYQIFCQILEVGDGLVLAHHQADQAETMLLNLIRGAGVNGLAAMQALQPLAKGQLIRPFLAISKEAITQYALQHKIPYIEDDSNQDLRFSRNYLRQQVLPLITKRWPKCTESMTRSAINIQESRRILESITEEDLMQVSVDENGLDLSLCLKLPPERLVCVLRAWLSKQGLRAPSKKRLNLLINEVILAKPGASPVFRHDKKVVTRFKNRLFLKPDDPLILSGNLNWENDSIPLKIEGVGVISLKPSEQGLSFSKLDKLSVGFRTGGETIRFRGQTKKVKKLLQDLQVPSWKRDRVPLLYINQQLAAVGEWIISDDHYGEKNAKMLEFKEA